MNTFRESVEKLDSQRCGGVTPVPLVTDAPAAADTMPGGLQQVIEQRIGTPIEIAETDVSFVSSPACRALLQSATWAALRASPHVGACDTPTEMLMLLAHRVRAASAALPGARRPVAARGHRDVLQGAAGTVLAAEGRPGRAGGWNRFYGRAAGRRPCRVRASTGRGARGLASGAAGRQGACPDRHDQELHRRRRGRRGVLT
jgi:hypothetical protein